MFSIKIDYKDLGEGKRMFFKVSFLLTFLLLFASKLLPHSWKNFYQF